MLQAAQKRVEKWLSEQNIHSDIQFDPSRASFMVRFSGAQAQDLLHRGIKLKDFAQAYSQAQDVDINFHKSRNKKRARTDYTLTFSYPDIVKVLQAEAKMQSEQVAKSQTEKPKPPTIHDEHKQPEAPPKRSFIITVGEHNKRVVSWRNPSPQQSRNQRLKQSLSAIIDDQQVNRVSKHSRRLVQYKGRYKVTVGRKRVYVDFDQRAITNWPSLKRLYRHILTKLGERYDQQYLLRNLKTLTATMSFEKMNCLDKLVPENLGQGPLLHQYKYRGKSAPSHPRTKTATSRKSKVRKQLV